MAEVSFKLDAQGRQLFFPWGALGRGYVVPSETEHARLLEILSRMTKVGMVGVILLVSLVRPRSLALLILPPTCLAHHLWVRRTTRGWPPTEERLSMRESFAAQAIAVGWPLLWALLLGSLLFVVAGIYLLIVRPDEWSTSVAAILFFGVCSAAYSWMIWLRTSPWRS